MYILFALRNLRYIMQLSFRISYIHTGDDIVLGVTPIFTFSFPLLLF